jgi:hypothetical protein
MATKRKTRRASAKGKTRAKTEKPRTRAKAATKTRVTTAKKRPAARATPKRRRGKPAKTAALVRTSKRDQEAAKSGVSKSKRAEASSGAGARDFPDAIYEDERRS